MRDDFTDRRPLLGWALPSSLVLHSLIVAYLFFGLPVPMQQPQNTGSVGRRERCTKDFLIRQRGTIERHRLRRAVLHQALKSATFHN
jgi:hypothetical protein